jgi:ATP-dependent Clp protease ATP-binding subunit ClpC
MIAEATPAEVNACRRLLPGLLDAFKVFRLDSLTDAEAIEILSRLAQTHAASVRLEIKPGVALLTHRLFKRFQPYAAFPGPAAAFIRTLCDPARHKEQKGSERVVDVEQVVRLFARQTGLPEIFLRDDLTLEIETVRHWLATRIVGQPAAVDSAARLLTTIKAGLNDPGRPLGVYLYCGPTGVGKTALAKALSEYCFGTGRQVDRLVRLDMSEYGGWDAARRLLESPQGGPASWIDRVRRQPFCVVLFDEVEKAAPEVFDLLLGLLDEGRLTDRLGRVTDFRSAIILLTSNLGAGARSAMGFAESSGPSYETAAGKFFRPEFFNRLDGVVTFKPLEFEEIKAIARKELAELAEREGLASAGLVLRVSESVATLAAKEGYDPQLGARPLQRAIERLAVSPLSRWKVAHPDVRDVTLLMDLDEQEKVTVVVDLAK